MKPSIQAVIAEIENEEKSLEEQGVRTNWIIEREAIRWICEQVKEKEPKVIVECGTSVGYSTIWLAEAASEYGGRVLSIERDLEKTEIAKSNIAKTKIQNIELIEGDATEVLKNWNGPEIDFLFLDANKKGYLPQFLAAKEHFTENASLIADNVIDMQERIQTFLTHMVEMEVDFDSRIIDRWDGLLVAEKKK